MGQSVTVDYDVAPSAPGAGTPTGDVTVSDGSVSCTATVATGHCTLTFATAGARSLTATYAGDSRFNASTSAAEAHTVGPASTTTAISSDGPDPSDVGNAVTVQYAVAPVAPGAGTPTGNVTVSDGVNDCTGTVAAGSCEITLTTAGARPLTATYGGNSDFKASTSAPEPHMVDGDHHDDDDHLRQPGSLRRRRGRDRPLQRRSPAAVRRRATSPSATASVSCTATVAAGQCVLALTTAGAKPLTATYAGAGTFNGSVSAVEPHTVNRANTTTTITADGPDPSRKVRR